MKEKVLPHILQRDVENISQIPIIERLLTVVCQSTGMGFAAVARVTEDTWMACAVHDKIGFGLQPGGELELETTICHEIRQSGKLISIDHVLEDSDFKNHHTPALYGFQSYLSVPIVRRDGTFFGTLCAIDPHPRNVSNETTVDMFVLFADLISYHLDTVEQLHNAKAEVINERAFKKALEEQVLEGTKKLRESNENLQRANADLLSVNYVASHDLQEPLRKIQTFVSLIQKGELKNFSEQGKNNFDRLTNAAERMQTLISDLFTYSQADFAERKFKKTDLTQILAEVKDDLKEEIEEKNVAIHSEKMCTAKVIPFQIRQLFHNLISNSIKYAHPDRSVRINVSSEIIAGSSDLHEKLDPSQTYCHIQIADNGIGFDPQYKEKIFELFKRLHSRSAFSGTGIGLAIVKKIVDNHNGLVSADGHENTGAEFNIFIPVT
ncbi:MAG TPA: ATP-binding protein [Flavobacterium sp.]|jgi:signal transduction histidine kinase